MVNACILAAMTMMNGFGVKSKEVVPEVSATLWKMEYVKNGAELVWMDCEDENRTFAIAFRTLPNDDSGVAHIVEHSVLCGSEKFPSRQPFVEMLKSSPHTYLNASTSCDVTVYPCASRNEKDFLNLVDVYIDAVFNPLSVKYDWAMRQEGWHYEFDGKNLTRNGVVYSEMKGSLANPNTIAMNSLMKMLFPNSPYQWISGGDPEHIPELTFEKYRAFHSRFYHPSNARIFLYGKIDLEKTLPIIARALDKYERRDEKVIIPWQAAVSGKTTRKYASNETKDRTIVYDGYVYSRYDEREKLLGLEILTELLTGSNFSPLKKPLLDAGLCEDVRFGVLRLQQPMIIMSCQNVKDGKSDECRKMINETLVKICKEGIDGKRILQLLDKYEFSSKEWDSANRGVATLFEVLNTWIYGGDPLMNLESEKYYASLRKRVGTGWYEQLLKEAVVDNPYHCELTMVPSNTLTEEKAIEDKKKLEEIKATMSENELRQIADAAAWLKRHQSEPESKEVLATLPRLGLSDIQRECKLPKSEMIKVDNVVTIRPKLEIHGFFYLNLCFALDGLSTDELLDVPLMAELFGELGSANYSAEALKGELDGKLGRFGLSTKAYENGSQLIVQIAALNSHREDVLALIKEVLLSTDFSNQEAIEKLRLQGREYMEYKARGKGALELACLRARSCIGSLKGARDFELFDGVSQLRHLQKGTIGDMAILSRKIFSRERLTICTAGGLSDEYLRKVIAIFPENGGIKSSEGNEPASLAANNEGFAIEGEISYAAQVAKLPVGVEYNGAQQVAAKIISLEHLWQEIRIKGGAYGVYFYLKPNGAVVYCSYRDPNPARTYSVFADVGKALEEFVKQGHSFEKYQISTAEDTDPNLSKREQLSFAQALYFNGRTGDFLQRIRDEILSTSAEDLLNFAETLKAISKTGLRCAFGNEKALEKCGLDHIEKVTSF